MAERFYLCIDLKSFFASVEAVDRGLDPFTTNQLKKYFVEHSKNNNLVLFSSHNLDIVEKLCDRVYIIDQGEILREINLKEFRESGENLEEYFLSITNRVSQ